MELQVFTEQLEQCYNILAQQFVLIKQLKDLTIKDGTNDVKFTEITSSINNLGNLIAQATSDIRAINGNLDRLSNDIQDRATKTEFEGLVRETPTDVRVVKDQDKWQLQLEHDTNVLSIDEGLQTALDSVESFKMYYHYVYLSLQELDGSNLGGYGIALYSDSNEDYTQPDDLVYNTTIITESFFSIDDYAMIPIRFGYLDVDSDKVGLVYFDTNTNSIKAVKVTNISNDVREPEDI